MSDKNPFFGATFAERKAARLGIEKGPGVEELPPAARVEPKQVDREADAVEDKAIGSAQTKKRPARKKP